MRTRNRAGIVMVFLGVVESGLIPNMPNGFYCGDPKISYKFTGDTINITSLLVGTFTVPLIVLWLIEACNCSEEDYNMSNPLKRRSFFGARLMWRWYREYIIGLIIVIFVTEFVKPLVGEPRPHFLDTCKPDMAENCTRTEYVQSYTCTNKAISLGRIQDSTRSFPSGHAAMSVYTSLFLMWFIQRRVSPNISYLLVPWLQCLCVVWAFGCSMTRITDNRHHWWDVLAGSVLGLVIAVYTIKTFCSGFCLTSSKATSRFRTRSSNVEGVKENGHVVNNGNQNQSVRRLLSSTSSYNSTVSPEDKELKEVPMA